MTTRDKPPWLIEADEVFDRLIESLRRLELGWPVELVFLDDPRDLVKPGTEVSKTPGDPEFSLDAKDVDG